MPQARTAKRSATRRTSAGFTAEERAAMKARAQELKSAGSKADEEAAAVAAIAKMPQPWRAIGQKLHAIIKASAPDLSPKTWYGMPAYAKDGKVVCYFRGGDKFKEHYLTFGFNDAANLDDGHMWPIAYAVTQLTAADEAKIRALMKRAVS